jgi:1-acyl-sn-glycerol-3-phosphate acyltransferase
MLGALMYGFIYSFLHAMRGIRIFRWSAEGMERLPTRERGGMIIAMNHIHWMDIPVIGAMLPFSHRLSWLGKSELFQNPVVGWWLRQMQVIPIRRGKRDLAALDAAVEGLRAGAVLLIFPEGHRSRSGVLQPGRGGAVRLAMQSGVPIVPVGVIGTEHGLDGSFRRRPVLLRVGEPFTIAPTPDGKIPPELMDQLTSDMMQRIAALLPEERRGPYALPAPVPSQS